MEGTFVMAIGYDNKVTLGNMLTMGTFAIGLAIGFANFQSAQAESQRRIELLEVGLKEQAIVTAAHEREFETRLRAAELVSAGQSSDLRNILASVNELKSTIDRLADQIGTNP